MKKHLILVSLILLPLIAQAQEQTEYLKTKALSFSFNGLNLNGINGGIGGKMWTTNALAWTLGLSANINSQQSDATSTLTEGTMSQSSAQLQIGIECHNNITNNFSPYFASSLFFGFNIQKNKPSVFILTTGYENNQTLFIGGLQIGFGAEYWISQRISLAGQQLFKFSYQFGNNENNSSTNLQKQNVRIFNVGLGTTSLILSIYF